MSYRHRWKNPHRAAMMLNELLGHHAGSCPLHEGHALLRDAPTALCMECEVMVCTVCGVTEQLEHDFEVFFYITDPGEEKRWVCQLFTQGDLFAAKHHACAGGHHAHVH